MTVHQRIEHCYVNTIKEKKKEKTQLQTKRIL